MKAFTAVGDHDKISVIVSILTNDFALSPQANHRKVRPAGCSLHLTDDSSFLLLLQKRVEVHGCCRSSSNPSFVAAVNFTGVVDCGVTFV